MEQSGLEWDLVAIYNNEEIRTGTRYYRTDFELYKSRSDQIAWSPGIDGKPHINPQEGVSINSVNGFYIARMLDEIARTELKTPSVNIFVMEKENKDLVNRILKDLRLEWDKQPHHIGNIRLSLLT
jgi:hypothetical protein